MTKWALNMQLHVSEIALDEAPTLFGLGVSRCRTRVGADHRYLNYIKLYHFSNYYQCQYVGVWVMSTVCAS
jgi:hypothetical protein